MKLNYIRDLGAVRIKRLLDCFGTFENILSAKENELKQVFGIGDKLSREICGIDLDVDKEFKKLSDREIEVVTVYDEGYPENLKSLYDPPFLLYVKGKIIPDDRYAISIVGTRKPTPYGRSVAGRISYDLSKKNVTVVSGMARGIDTFAHEGALKAGGRTIAVLGSGLDVCYPPENRRLLERIAASGAVISEYPLSTMPDKRNFPVRNRIISGLGLGTLVVEAAEKSGALITADAALEQGRDVFAVPGNITSLYSAGTNALIKQGAALVSGCEDILKEIDCLAGRVDAPGKKSEEGSQISGLSSNEKKVYDILSFEPAQIDFLSLESGFSIKEISVILMSLEMKGKIDEVQGKRYIRRI